MVKLERYEKGMKTGSSFLKGSHMRLSKWLNVVPVWDEGYFSFVILTFLCLSVFLSLFAYSIWLYRRRTRTKTSVSVHSTTFLTCLRHGNSWERSSLARRWDCDILPYDCFCVKVFFHVFFFCPLHMEAELLSFWVSVFCLELLSTFTKQTLNIS